ncbi:MAG: hypothetical protein JNJ55_13355 [Betaproteobacteria bacterium]|nr:hypothetical protein [Betaproteobacteria bacterium]
MTPNASLFATLAPLVTALTVAQAPAPAEEAKPAPVEVERTRPNSEPLKYELPPIDPKQVEPPTPLMQRDSVSVPDRWRIMDTLGFKFPWYDPYNHNVWKGDKPFEPFAKWGTDWFLALSGISDTLIESRRLPTPVGLQSTNRAGGLDIFGRSKQHVFVETAILSIGVIKGNTTFKPPDYEFRLVPAFQVNHARIEEVRGLRINPAEGKTRTDNHVGIQEAFVDVHLRNVSDRYDFDSYRVGIQPFQSDFRGFIFQDVPFGFRLFGIRDNNQWQYNLAAFIRMEKDTNSGLNDVNRAFRRDYVLAANLYRQDFPVLGHTTQGTVILNLNRERESNFFDNNGVLIRPAILGDGRPRNYDVAYFGINGDGHFGVWNVTSAFYAAIGRDERHPLAQRKQDIRAAFAAAEVSRDFSWLRVRGNALVASGDSNPFDGKATGFDAIFENPQFAGADTSFFIRQAVPLIGGGGVALSQRNGVLPSLRSSKDQGQSNFVNPGLLLAGFGADADLTPQLRVLGNISKLNFVNTSSLGVLRNQAAPSKDLGVDISIGAQYRPFMSQNVVLNASAAALMPGKGLKQLYDEDKRGAQYSVLVNLLLTY